MYANRHPKNLPHGRDVVRSKAAEEIPEPRQVLCKLERIFC